MICPDCRLKVIRTDYLMDGTIRYVHYMTPKGDPMLYCVSKERSSAQFFIFYLLVAILIVLVISLIIIAHVW